MVDVHDGKMRIWERKLSRLLTLEVLYGVMVNTGHHSDSGATQFLHLTPTEQSYRGTIPSDGALRP